MEDSTLEKVGNVRNQSIRIETPIAFWNRSSLFGLSLVCGLYSAFRIYVLVKDPDDRDFFGYTSPVLFLLLSLQTFRAAVNFRPRFNTVVINYLNHAFVFQRNLDVTGAISFDEIDHVLEDGVGLLVYFKTDRPLRIKRMGLGTEDWENLRQALSEFQAN